MAGVMIGIDPHKGSHTAVALDAREKAAGTASGARVEEAGRGVAGVGRALAETDVGDRGRARAGSAIEPAANRRRGARAGCAAQAGRGCGC